MTDTFGTNELSLKEFNEQNGRVDNKENDLVEKGQSTGEESIDCVAKVIGDFGPWHMHFLAYFTAIHMISSFHNTGIVFYAARNNFWCSDLSHNLTELEQKALINKCIPNCKRYDYDRSMVHTTIVTEFGLICDRAWFVSACASIYQIGYAVSSLSVSYASDRFGRKLIFKSMMILEIVFGLGQALVPNIYLFLINRFFLGIVSYGRFLTGNLLIMENAGPKHRAFLSIFVDNGFFVGKMLLITSFYFISNYKYVQFIVTGFQISSLIYLNITPESIRWLLTRARYDEAKKSLYIAANLKRKKYSAQELDRRINSLVDYFENAKKVESSEKSKVFTLFRLWRLPGMFKLCLIFYSLWFTNRIVTYSTTFNSTDFGDNIYLNIGVFALASCTANLIISCIIERFKRLKIAKVSLFFMFLTLFALTVDFYREEHFLTPIDQLDNNRTIKNQFDLTMANNYSQLRQNAQNLNIDIKLILNESTLKKRIKNQSLFRLSCAIMLRYCASFAFYMIYIITVENFPREKHLFT